MASHDESNCDAACDNVDHEPATTQEHPPTPLERQSVTVMSQLDRVCSVLHAPRQLTKEAIQELPFHYYRPVRTRERYRETDSCVCMQQFKKCERMAELPCGHRMHRRCSVSSLQVDASCPHCQSKFK